MSLAGVIHHTALGLGHEERNGTEDQAGHAAGEESRLPRDLLGHRAADGEAEGRPEGHGQVEEGEHARPLLFAKQIRDDRGRDGAIARFADAGE